MKKFYIMPSFAQQGKKTKAVFITFTMMLFTMAFAQAQETNQSDRNESISFAKQKAHQPIIPETTGQPLSIRTPGATNEPKTLRLGNTTTSSAATDCGKGAVSVEIDQAYGNLNTHYFADDLVVLPLENFLMDEMEIIFLLDYNVNADEIFLDFYQDAATGGPGALFPVSLAGAQVNIENLGEYGNTIKDIMVITVTLPTPIEFTGGVDGASYWASVRITHDGTPNSAASIGTNIMSASQTFYVNRSNTWEKNTVAYNGVPQQDLLYGFYGQCEEVLGVENNNLLSGINLFPNPLTDDAFYINAPQLNGKKVAITISDMAGRQIYNDTLNCQDNKITVSTNTTLSAGVYLVILKFAGQESIYRLVKQ